MGTSASAVIGKVIRTRMGWVGAATRDEKLVAVSLPVASKTTAVADLGMPCDLQKKSALLERLAAELPGYFAGERLDFTSYPVDLSSHPPFQRAALLAARTIPYGEVRSYRWLAEKAGSPRASRAAGQAMRNNPLPLVIPCHRVVGANGSLTGFGGGLAMKRALLLLESAPLGEEG
jgi:methylated-DNA-[protein]-cysteine S-methyltransferase